MSTSINIAAIERELNSLWKQAGSDDDHSSIIRACLLNLLVYIPDPASANKIDEIVVEISRERPARAILMIADRDSSESSLAAHVTSQCTVPDGMSKQVCCEEVTITASGAQVNEMPSAVVPLLMPDLPVYLWWQGVPQLSDKVFTYLGEISDRVIIDSSKFADPHGDTVKLATLIRDNPKWTAFTDLNWARLTAWRALFAGFYDVAQYRPILDETNSLVIEYAPSDQNPQAIPARVMLLAGWMTSRLRWTLTENPVKREGASTIFNFSADGRKITIHFVSTANTEIRHGLIASATIGCTKDNHADFKVSRSADGKRIETAVQIAERSHIQRVLGYESWDEAALIGREIEILGHDRVYEQAIVAAGQMITALDNQ